MLRGFLCLIISIKLFKMWFTTTNEGYNRK